MQCQCGHALVHYVEAQVDVFGWTSSVCRISVFSCSPNAGVQSCYRIRSDDTVWYGLNMTAYVRIVMLCMREFVRVSFFHSEAQRHQISYRRAVSVLATPPLAHHHITCWWPEPPFYYVKPNRHGWTAGVQRGSSAGLEGSITWRQMTHFSMVERQRICTVSTQVLTKLQPCDGPLQPGTAGGVQCFV
jgi:hypothetical protein